jgi:hypothetical protein
MSTYPLDELLTQWSRGDLTPEQAIGHLLQHIKQLHERHQQLLQCLEAAAASSRSAASSAAPRPTPRRKA